MFRFLRSKIIELITNWCVNPRTISICELHEMHRPSSCEIYDGDRLKFIEQGCLENIMVQTDVGYSSVKRSMMTVKYRVWELSTASYTLHAADEHIVILANGDECKIIDLKEGDVIQTLKGPETVLSVQELDTPPVHMYDLELDDDRHLYYTGGILSHNSTVSAIYLLWFACFKKDKTILIASNKNKGAMEMISRIRYAYEELPHWLKPGVQDDMWNKHAVGFDNGSKIESTATTESSGRGMSISLLFCLGGNTGVTVRNKRTGEVKNVTMEMLYKRLMDDETIVIHH